MKKAKKIKKKLTKLKSGFWDTSDLYKSGRTPFEIEWIKYYNPMEGRDQIIFLYLDRKTKKICKSRILR